MTITILESLSNSYCGDPYIIGIVDRLLELLQVVSFILICSVNIAQAIV